MLCAAPGRQLLFQLTHFRAKHIPATLDHLLDSRVDLALDAAALGLFVWFGLTVALCLHLTGGVRHLIWDAGRGLSPKAADALSWASIVGGVLIAVAFWAFLFSAGRVGL